MEIEGGSGNGDYIYTSAINNVSMYIGGDFDSIGQMFSFQKTRIQSCLAYLNISEMQFHSVANQCDGSIRKISINNGTIYAVGDFNNLIPNKVLTTGAVAYLGDDGAWRGLGSLFNQRVNAIVFWNESIIIGLENSGSLNNLAIFENGEWKTLSNGVDGGGVKDLYVLDDNLYVVGHFESVNGGMVNTRGIASLDLIDMTWSSIASLGDDEYINSMYVDSNEDIFVVGSFAPISGSDPNIAKYDGFSWSSVASQAFPVVDDAILNVISGDNGTLIIGGIFSSSSYNNIAIWNGTQWHGLRAGLTCSNMCNASVTTITPFPHLIFVPSTSPTFSFDTFFKWKPWAIMAAGALIVAGILSLLTLMCFRLCSCNKS